MPALIRVVPTDDGQLALEFRPGGIRLFDFAAARLERDQAGAGWPGLQYPETFKHLTFSADGVRWPGGTVLAADALFTGSRPLGEPELERQSLRVAYRNQAPTREHPSHHVYAVYVRPFAAKQFLIGESINGGHLELGGSIVLSCAELLAWPGWEQHFELSGCDWAVPLISASGTEERARVDAVVLEVCRRAGTDESDVGTYAWKRNSRPA
jgi:hypothetical protein